MTGMFSAIVRWQSMLVCPRGAQRLDGIGGFHCNAKSVQYRAYFACLDLHQWMWWCFGVPKPFARSGGKPGNLARSRNDYDRHIKRPICLQEPTVIYEGSPVIFTGQKNVFKMWHTCGWYTGNVCYAESTDGFNFTRLNGGQPIISGVGRPFVLHIGNTYYLYATQEMNSPGWYRYVSSDGINWQLTDALVLKSRRTKLGEWDIRGQYLCVDGRLNVVRTL